MSWFGESLANIKGQITNFTKEVLSDNPEDEEEGQEGQSGGQSSELDATRKAFEDLQGYCALQKKEIDQLKEFIKQQGLNEGEESSTSAGFAGEREGEGYKGELVLESYEQRLREKSEENEALKTRMEELQKEYEAKLVQQLQQVRQEYESKTWVSTVQEGSVPSVSIPQRSITAQDAFVQTQEVETSISLSEVGTLTDIEEEDEAAKIEEESYRRELEERCNAYQQDLYVLRGELMTIQADVDQEEELRAKFNEDVITLLHSEFILDGQPTLSKPKYQRPDTNRASEEIILRALRQLSTIWRGILDQKTTLERTVTKLSTPSGAQPQSNPASSAASESVDISLGELQAPDACDTLDFFPPHLDSFGLETILEEERNEDESKHESDDLYRSKTSSVDMSCQHELEFCNTFTQTDQLESNHESLRTEILASVEEAYKTKECSWAEQLEQRNAKVLRLESELVRLKNHLVDLEDCHTGEMLALADREKDLQDQVHELQQQISRLLQQSERSGDVKEEISRLETEREFAKAQCLAYEDQIQKLAVQLQNLNFVLEQFQKEKEIEIATVRKQLELEMSRLHSVNKTLADELRLEKELLEKARSGLDAASLLNAQIEEKSRIVSTLKVQVQERETEVAKLKTQLDEVSNTNVAKVDRYLIKNLVVGYFSTPKDKRDEVLRIIATVLDFNREDRQRTGLEPTSYWPFRSSENASGGDSGQSLSQAFIKFLETESQPKAQIKIPMEEIARKHSRTGSESSDTSGSGTAVTTRPHQSEISMALPVLNQADRSNSILKDVLNPKT